MKQSHLSRIAVKHVDLPVQSGVKTGATPPMRLLPIVPVVRRVA